MPAGAPGNAQSVNALVNQALMQEEQRGGGGGGGGGHGGGHGGAKKAGLEAIDDIAARAALNVERGKSVPARRREIEQMQAEMVAEDEAVGEKDAGDHPPDDREDEDEPEAE